MQEWIRTGDGAKFAPLRTPKIQSLSGSRVPKVVKISSIQNNSDPSPVAENDPATDTSLPHSLRSTSID